jgi:hypothetical protein
MQVTVASVGSSVAAAGASTWLRLVLICAAAFSAGVLVPRQASVNPNTVSQQLRHRKIILGGFKPTAEVFPGSQIPCIIHQSWKTASVPPVYSHFSAAWPKMHPKCTYKLWTDADNRNLFASGVARAVGPRSRRAGQRSTKPGRRVSHPSGLCGRITHLSHPTSVLPTLAVLPEYLFLYDRLPKNIMRADMSRLAYMYIYGGVYADLDLEPLRPLDSMLRGRGGAVLAWMGTPAWGVRGLGEGCPGEEDVEPVQQASGSELRGAYSLRKPLA